MIEGYIHSIESMGLVDGPGIRTVVFFQGCRLRCRYCHNPDTWAMRSGKEQIFTPEQLVNKLLRFKPYFGNNGGVTFSGGEPFAQPEGFAALAALLHEKGYEVASYSGYTFEQLFTGTTAQKQLLSQLDVLIDGPFLLSEKSLELNFRGSRNQRVLNVPESLRAGSPVPETSDRWLGEY